MKPKRGKVPKKKGHKVKDLDKKLATAAKTLRARGRSKSRTNGSGQPHSQVLPGMKKNRDEILDNHAETVEDARSTMATAKADEKGALQAALKRMTAKGYNTYKHGKVTFIREEGEDRIRCRVSKETAQTGDEGAEIQADENLDTAEETEPLDTDATSDL